MKTDSLFFRLFQAMPALALGKRSVPSPLGQGERGLNAYK
jgi:hypothetical protein